MLMFHVKHLRYKTYVNQRNKNYVKFALYNKYYVNIVKHII